MLQFVKWRADNLFNYTERYLDLLATTGKVKGTKFLQQNYITERDAEIDLEAKVHPINKIQKLKEDPRAARPS
jgi:hypothetical protein